MLKRHIEIELLEALEYMPVVLLRGARQTGKTTLAKSLCQSHEEYQYITFDRLPDLLLAKEDPVGFISRLKSLLFWMRSKECRSSFCQLKVMWMKIDIQGVIF